MRRIETLAVLGALAGGFLVPAHAQLICPRLGDTDASGSGGIQASGAGGVKHDPLPPRAMARMGSLRLHHGAWTFAIGYSPDGATLISAGSTEARLWDVSTGKEVSRVKALELETSPEAILPDGYRPCAAAISPDGKRVAWGYRDQRVRIMELATGKEVCSFPGNTSGQYHPPPMAFTQDGRFFAAEVTERSQSTIRLWDLKAGERVQTRLQNFSHPGEALTFSPDGKTLASLAYDGTIGLWDVATGKLLRAMKGHDRTRTLAFAPDGKTLASA